MLQTLESDLCYANLTLHQTGSSASSSQKKAPRRLSSAQDGQEDVDYITMVRYLQGVACMGFHLGGRRSAKLWSLQAWPGRR